MAIDTAAKRKSSHARNGRIFGLARSLVADGSIVTADRRVILGYYSGIVSQSIGGNHSTDPDDGVLFWGGGGGRRRGGV